MESLSSPEAINQVKNSVPGVEIIGEPVCARMDMIVIATSPDSISKRKRFYLVYKNKCAVNLRELCDIPDVYNLEEIRISEGYIHVCFNNGTSSNLPLISFGLD
jgi:hypothetical protein